MICDGFCVVLQFSYWLTAESSFPLRAGDVLRESGIGGRIAGERLASAISEMLLLWASSATSTFHLWGCWYTATGVPSLPTTFTWYFLPLSPLKVMKEAPLLFGVSCFPALSSDLWFPDHPSEEGCGSALLLFLLPLPESWSLRVGFKVSLLRPASASVPELLGLSALFTSHVCLWKTNSTWSVISAWRLCFPLCKQLTYKLTFGILPTHPTSHGADWGSFLNTICLNILYQEWEK